MKKSEQYPLREWKKEERYLSAYQLLGSIEAVCRLIKETAKGMHDAQVTNTLFKDDEGYCFHIVGYIRGTPEEIVEFDKQSSKASVRAKKAAQSRRSRVRDKEILQLRRLKDKYPEVD